MLSLEITPQLAVIYSTRNSSSMFWRIVDKGKVAPVDSRPRLVCASAANDKIWYSDEQAGPTSKIHHRVTATRIPEKQDGAVY